jgi:glycosyltransferase involved in cell wall biosynthesis
MKLILLIPHISDGGAEKILSDLSFNLDLGEQLLVVFQEKPGYPFHGRLISMNLPIERQSVVARAFGFVRRIHRFHRIVQQEQPDCVVSFMGEANFINAVVSRRPILTVHNHLSSVSGERSRFESKIFDLLLRALYRRAKIIAVSEAVKDDLVKHFRIPNERVAVINTAIDAEAIRRKAAERAECPWDEDAPVIVTAGRLHPQKGQWHLLRAFAEVRKKMVCRMAILGTGDLEDYLRDLAKALGIEKDVYFLGWQENPFKFLAHGQVFVLPSVSEGFPLVLLEAMACGLPIVATDCPGSSKEILAPRGAAEFGVLIPPVDERRYGADEKCTAEESAMADAILSMLQDPGLRRKYVEAGKVRLRDFDRMTFFESYRRVITAAASTRQ